MNPRNLAKLLAYRSGAMSAHHARRNAQTLTVLMFHRVLPRKDMNRTGADPLYVVTPEFLADCAAFLRAHYAIVGLEDVLASKARKKRLPPKAALITFDDGWYDNLAFALPALASTPWTLFATADALLDPDCWWQEVLLWAIRSGGATARQLWETAESKIAWDEAHEPDPTYPLLLLYENLPVDARTSALAPYTAMLRTLLGDQPMMLDPSDLRTLQSAGVAIGAHGASHLPLSQSDDAITDMRRAQKLLTEWVGYSGASTMSFPHGRYNDHVALAARDLQYQLLFSSDAFLNRCDNGWIDDDLLGRIPVNMQGLVDENGRLAPHKLAPWLFLRDVRAPARVH